LTNVRRFWDYYGSMFKLSPTELASLSQKFVSDFRKTFRERSMHSMMTMGYRSLGPLFREGREILPHLFNSLARTGNVGGKDSKANTHVNPLFVYSSITDDRCALPPGISPIAGFHIAPALVTTVIPVEGLAPYSSNFTVEEKITRVVTYVKGQFRARCSAFRESRFITIYYNSDDIVRLCYSLRTLLDPSVDNIFDYCSAPWNPPRSFENFNVPQSPYGPFDVIETSSLADEIALPILLISSLSLLKRNAEATLYTTSLVPADDTPPEERLKALLYCEPVTMFALLSCVPVEYVSGFCNNSSLHEAAPSDVSRPSSGANYVWNFSWKWWIDIGSDWSVHTGIVSRTVWETDTMVKILYNIYQRMFKQEDLIGNLRITGSRATPPQCTRGSFIAFLRFLKYHVKADWKPIIEDRLPKLIESDYEGIHLAPFVPDFALQCHLHQLVTSYILSLKWGQHVLAPQYQDAWRDFINSSSQDLPALVFPYILRVPRARLHHLVPYLKANGPNGDIVFQIQLHLGDHPVGTFSSFEMTFGIIEPEDETELFIAYLGWEGEADLFVHISLPSTLLVCFMGQLGCTISFSIHYIRQPQKFKDIYGDRLIVFQTRFSDTRHFWPCGARKIIPPTRILPTEKPEAAKVGRVLTGPEITQLPGGLLRMTTRLDIYDEADKVDLVNGCRVDFHSVSPWKIIVQTPTWSITVPFPYPHDKDNTRLRISRKGGWFEIIAKFETNFNFDTILFPLVRDSTTMSTASWNLSRVVIDVLPTLDLSNFRQFDWIRANLKSMLPADDVAVMKDHGPEEAVGMSAIPKRLTLLSLFAVPSSKGVTGMDLQSLSNLSSRTVMLVQRNGRSNIPRAFIFVDSIKLHSSTDSVVADAYIWPLTPEVVEKHSNDIDTLARCSSSLQCEPEEFGWWTLFIQALVERARQWSHSGDCYANDLPGIAYFCDSILCSCGEGKVPAEFKANPRWEKFSPYVTRFALSPVFPVPYLNPISTDLEEYFTDTDQNTSPDKVDVAQKCLSCKSTPEKLKKCGKCGVAKYCSRVCQAKDWPRHKTECHSSL
jgi:MYND finger